MDTYPSPELLEAQDWIEAHEPDYADDPRIRRRRGSPLLTDDATAS